jgi:hypothetical protein
MATLQDLSKMSHEQLLAFAMAAQQQQGNKGTSIKVFGKGVKRMANRMVNGKMTQVETVGKGNVAVYGLQKFPITLYPKGWLTLLDMADEIRATIKANSDSLSWDRDED